MCWNDVVNRILIKDIVIFFCRNPVERISQCACFRGFWCYNEINNTQRSEGEGEFALKFSFTMSRFDAERKKLMSIAGIEQVRAAEAEADRIRKSAEDEAAALVANSKREARKLVEDAEAAAQQEYKEMLAKAAQEAEVLYENRTEEERKTCEEIKAAAREHLPEAVSAIVGKVVGTYGNS